MYSYRRRTAAEIEDAASAIARAFAPNAVEGTTAMLSMAFQSCPFMPIEQVWVVFEGERPVLQWQMLDFQARVGRCQVRVAGLFAVASLTGETGHNYLQAAQDVGYEMPASEGFDLILGFARRSRAFTHLKDTVPLGAEYTWSMEVPSAPVALQGFTRASDVDAPLLVELSNAANLGRSISLVRTADMWPWMQRKPPELWLGDGGYLGLRDGEGCLEVREAYGRTPAFYAQALRALFALAQARGVTKIMGHLPPDHPLVQISQHHGAELMARHDLSAGSFAGLMRPRAFMEKIHSELHDRWMAAHPNHALELRVDCEGHAFTQHFNTQASLRCALELRGSSGCLLHLCLGYASARATLQHHRGSARLEGEVSEAAALAALFPAQHPFISHTDRW